RRPPAAAQNPVSHATSPPFEPSHDGGQAGIRSEDRVHVIGHDHPRIELVEPAHRLTTQKRVDHHTGDSRILQPNGAGYRWDRRSVYVVCRAAVLSRCTSVQTKNVCLSREGAG